MGEGSSLRGAGLVRTLHQLCLFPRPHTPPPWADPARSTPEPACPPTAHTAQAAPAWTKLTRPTCDSAAQPARTRPHAAPWPPRSRPAPLTTRRPPGQVPAPTASGLPRTRPAACTSRRVSPGPRTLAAGRPLRARHVPDKRQTHLSPQRFLDAEKNQAQSRISPRCNLGHPEDMTETSGQGSVPSCLKVLSEHETWEACGWADGTPAVTLTLGSGHSRLCLGSARHPRKDTGVTTQ